MPYVNKADRDIMGPVDMCGIDNVGQLNFAISSMIHKFIVKNGGLKYANINAVVGVLECAKLELYRTVAGPYEDIKRRENGPVSELDARTLEDVR